MTPTTSLVPPRRLGTLLRRAREAAGRDLEDLRTESGLTVVELDDVEHGRRVLDEATLDALVAAYGIEGASLVPARSQLVIDLDEGRIAVDRDHVGIDPSYGPDAVLTRYLALVYRLRDLPIGTALPLRDVDIEVLATSLALADRDIESRLHRLMDRHVDVEQDQKRIRRQLLLPLVGVVIAATGVGTLVLVSDPGNQAPPAPASLTDVGASRIATAAVEDPVVVATDIGNGGAVEENPDA